MAAAAKKKKKRKASERTEESVPRDGCLTSITRTGVTVILLGLILYVTLFIFARTDGFRSFLENRLEEELGIQVEIGQSRLGWAGDLWLNDIGPGDASDEGLGSLRIHQVHFRCRPLDLLTMNLERIVSSAEIKDWALTFAETPEGTWEPVLFDGFNQWLDKWFQVDVIESDAPSPGPGGNDLESDALPAKRFHLSLDDIHVQATGGVIAWVDAEGTMLTSAHDMDVFVTPLNLPTRVATHIHVRASSIQLSPWSEIRDVNVELLQTGDSYRVLQLRAERHGSSRPAADVSGERPIHTPEVVAPVLPVTPEPVVIDRPLPEPVLMDPQTNPAAPPPGASLEG